MCGITGQFSQQPLDPSAVVDTEKALVAIKHRGPDDKGLWIGSNAVLGHARLSILDLSPQGHQPMTSPDGTMVIVFNGEIYNYQDIRRELEALGHQFRSSGDTEVALRSIQQWGVEFALSRFIGMFSMAVWNDADESLTLIRDRLGVKPLYYGWDGHRLWFGSELKALRAYRHWSPSISQAGLTDYFRHGYVKGQNTIYSGLHKLEPAHWLKVSRTGAPVVRRYWSVLSSIDHTQSRSESDVEQELHALLVDSAKLRMVSDVPVGVFLSGGIDSSLVAALLQRHHGNIHTFSIGFDVPEFNEAPFAKEVAAHLGTQHTEQILLPSAASEVLPLWGDLYDEPMADSSGIPTYLVSKLASRHVKVVLSADGGDELFAGYNNHTSASALNGRREFIPSWSRPLLRTLIGGDLINQVDSLLYRLPLAKKFREPLRDQMLRRLKRVNEYYLGAGTEGELYAMTMSPYWRRGDLQRLLGASEQVAPDPFQDLRGSFLEKACLWDLHNYLPGDILPKVDRATMAHSIEGREPLLDHRLVEFAFSLPFSLRRGKLGPKHLLRKVLYDYVPRKLIDRPKMGFGIPLENWLRNNYSHLVDELCSVDGVSNSGLLCKKEVQQSVRQFKAGDKLITNKIWSLVAFQLWYRRWK